MKNKILYIFLAIFLFVLPAKSGQGSNFLNQAINLYSSSNYAAAKITLTNINSTDISYPTAIFYKCLCLYSLGNTKGFLIWSQNPVITNANVSPEMFQDLYFKRIQTLSNLRRFDEALTNINILETKYPNSSYLNNLKEYKLANLYEKGKKLDYDYSLSPTNTQTRLADSRKCLADFLRLYRNLNITNYLFLTDRDLQQEVVDVRLMGGSEQILKKEYLVKPIKQRESLDSSSLHLKLRTKEIPTNAPNSTFKMGKLYEYNLEKIKEFETNYPNSSENKRLKFRKANTAFNLFEKYYITSKHFQSIKNTNSFLFYSNKAEKYFQYSLDLTNSLFVDTNSSILEGEIYDTYDDILHGYMIKGDYQSTLNQSDYLINNYTNGSLLWLLGNFYKGTSLSIRSRGEDTNAVSLFETNIAQGFDNRANQNSIIISSIEWRIEMSLNGLVNDTNLARAKEFVNLVKNSQCNKHQKLIFLDKYAYILNIK